MIGPWNLKNDKKEQFYSLSVAENRDFGYEFKLYVLESQDAT